MSYLEQFNALCKAAGQPQIKLNADGSFVIVPVPKIVRDTLNAAAKVRK
jgi:hypothetical protein